MCNNEKCQCKCKQECECKHPKFDRMAGLMFHHNWVRLARMNDEIRLKLNSMKCLDSRQVKDNSPELERQAALYL